MLKIKLFFVIVSCATSMLSIAQLEVKIPSEIDLLKKGTTFLVMTDPSSDSVKDHIKVFQDYWTFSKVKAISYEQVADNLAPENTFISISGLEVPKNSYTIYYFYMDFWYCDASFFKKLDKAKSGKRLDIQKTSIAKIELYSDKKSWNDSDLLINSNFDGGGHVFNWGAGIVKNYIQTLNSFLDRKENRGFATGVLNKEKMNALQKETLFIPEFTLHKYNNFNGSGDDDDFYTEKELLFEYKEKYELISDAELNDRILASDDDFYYLLFVRNGNSKYMVVVNSITGEWIYADKAIGFSIGVAEFKTLQKIVSTAPKK